MNDAPPTSSSSSPHHTTLRLDWRVIAAILFAAILVMLYLWQPWQPATTKTITVRGEATVKAVPDSYQFQPTYQNEDTAKVTATGNAVVARLKELGVKSADIKTTASAAPRAESTNASKLLPPDYYSPKSTFTITATVSSQELAQKIADYLATTKATGQVTPTASFSQAARTKLDLEARKSASADAKRKGEVLAGQFGAKLGRVTKITEDGGVGIYALDSRNAAALVRLPI